MKKQVNESTTTGKPYETKEIIKASVCLVIPIVLAVVLNIIYR